MAWAWSYPYSIDETKGGSYSAGQFDFAGWEYGVGWVGWNTETGSLYPSVSGYGEVSHDEDWYYLGIDLPIGHYALTVKANTWDPTTASSGSIAYYGVNDSLNGPNLFETTGSGTTYFTIDETQSAYGLYAYLSGSYNASVQYEITFEQVENASPIVSSTPVITASEDSPYSYHLDVTDANSDELSISVEKPDWLNWDPTSRTLSGTPLQSDIGSHRIEFVITDGWGGSTTQYFDLNVESVNDSPVTSALEIVGDLAVGRGLEIDLSTLSDEDGLGGITHSWYADGQRIEGATSTKLFLTSDFAGASITYEGSYTDGYGTVETVHVARDGIVDAPFSEQTRADRVIGVALNSPEISATPSEPVDTVSFDINFRTVALGNGSSVVAFAEGESVNLKLIDSSGAVTNAFDGINTPFIDGSFEIVPSFKPVESMWYSESLDVTALGSDKFIVSWLGPHIYGSTSSHQYTIYARIYSNTGIALTDTIHVSQHWDANIYNPNIVSWGDGTGFSVGYIERYTDLFLDHYSVSDDSGAVSVQYEGSDSGLVPSSLGSSPQLDSIKITTSGSEYLVSAISGNSAENYYMDAVSWRLSGSRGSLAPTKLAWLSGVNGANDPYENRSTELVELTNGDVVVTYWGYSVDPITNSRNGDVSMNLNAQIVHVDGTVEAPIVIGRTINRDNSVSTQPFSLSDGYWGVAWTGSPPGEPVGLYIDIFNPKGEAVGQYYEESTDRIVQSSATPDGLITLTSLDSSGTSTMSIQTVSLNTDSLGLFSASMLAGDGTLKLELNSISRPDSAPSVDGLVHWFAGGELVGTTSGNQPFEIPEELIGQSVTASFTAINNLGDKQLLVVDADNIIEVLDTHYFTPSLHESDPVIILAPPAEQNYQNNIDYIYGQPRAGVFVFSDENGIGVIQPSDTESTTQVLYLDIPQSSFDVQLTVREAGGYLLLYRSASRIYTQVLDDNFVNIGGPTDLTPGYTGYSSPFFIYDSSGSASAIGYHYLDTLSYPSKNYAYRVLIDGDGNPEARTVGTPFEPMTTENNQVVSIEVLDGEPPAYLNGSKIVTVNDDVTTTTVAAEVPTGVGSWVRLATGNFVSVSGSDFTIYDSSFERVKFFSSDYGSDTLTPTADGGFISGTSQFSAAGEYMGEVGGPLIGSTDNTWLGGGEAAQLLLPDGTIILASAATTNVGWAYGISLTRLSPQLQLWGESVEDETLVATTSGLNISDANIVWKADGSVVQQGKSSLTLTDEYVGKEISVSLLDNDGGQILQEVRTAIPVENINDLPEGPLSFVGSMTQGTSITIDLQHLRDQDGLGDIQLQWYADDQVLPGQQGLSLELEQDLAGAVISVEISYTDQRGTQEQLTLRSQTPVSDQSYAVTGQVTLSGTVEKYNLVMADVEAISDLDGIASIHYQWKADGSPLTLANSQYYRIQEDDLGKALSVEISIIDGEGNTTIQETQPQTVADATPPIDFTLSLREKNTVSASETLNFVVNSSHSADILNLDKVRVTNGALLTSSTEQDGLTHTITVQVIDKSKPVFLTLEAGVFVDRAFGVSSVETLESTGFQISSAELPETLYNIAGNFRAWDNSLHQWDLYDKVSFDDADYYYVDDPVAGSPMRPFSEVAPTIFSGAFTLSLPTQSELKALFTSGLVDGTSSANYIDRDNEWWQNYYWYSTSESGQFDSAMWLADGYNNIFTDGYVTSDKYDALTVYKVSASSTAQIFNLSAERIVEGEQQQLAIVRSGSLANDQTYFLEVSGLEELSKQLVVEDSTVEVFDNYIAITVLAGEQESIITYSVDDSLANATNISFTLIDAGTLPGALSPPPSNS